jgi:hypothetical protein
VSEEFLDRPDIVAIFKEMSPERMAEHVAARRLGEPGFLDRLLHRLLRDGLLEVVLPCRLRRKLRSMKSVEVFPTRSVGLTTKLSAPAVVVVCFSGMVSLLSLFPLSTARQSKV